MSKISTAHPAPVADAIFDLVLRIPPSNEVPQLHPAARAHAIARNAARKASLLSGSLSLPPGILGWLTVLPELIGVWKLQAQMVSDIASVYGQSKTLGREHMLVCLFKHVSAQLLRDVVVRVGERELVRQATLKTVQGLAKKLGVHLTKTIISKGAARFMPLLGAVSVGAYAYFDTLQVAKTATQLFEQEFIANQAASTVERA